MPWKQEAEAKIRQVQQAGNQLEDKVRVMGDEALQVRLEYADTNKQLSARVNEMEKEINGL